MSEDTSTPAQPIWRPLLAEFLGTALLVVAMIGSASLAETLIISDQGAKHLSHSLSIGFALAVLIAVFAPISGAHLNPAVSLAIWASDRKSSNALSVNTLVGYIIAQCLGGFFGALITMAMFLLPPTTASLAPSFPSTLIGEIVATFSLVLVILMMIRTNRPHLIAPCAGAIIWSAYWYTSSTAFANPAATIGRIFTHTYAGIPPVAALGFIAAQLVGAVLAVLTVSFLAPARPTEIPEQRSDTVDLTQDAQLPEQSRTDTAQ